MGIRNSLAIGAAVVALMAGCGGFEGDDTAADGQAEVEVPTTAAAAAGETVEITAVDYGFEGVPDSVETGTELTLTNDSEDEVHEMVVLRVDDDETRPLEELLQLPDEEAEQVTTFAGVSVALPGDQGVTPEGPVVLSEPGRYVMLCFIPTGADPDAYRQAIEGDATDAPQVEGGPPHVAEGMVAEFEVSG